MSVVLHQHCVDIFTVSFGEKGEGRILWQGDTVHAGVDCLLMTVSSVTVQLWLDGVEYCVF